MLAGTIEGRAGFEWFEGGRFLLYRAHADRPDVPDSLSLIGAPDEALSMYYFDSRGVHRVYRVSFEDGIWRMWRDAPGFAQRFQASFSDDGNTIAGLWELSRDGSTWDDDLAITYRRAE